MSSLRIIRDNENSEPASNSNIFTSPELKKQHATSPVIPGPTSPFLGLFSLHDYAASSPLSPRKVLSSLQLKVPSGSRNLFNKGIKKFIPKQDSQKTKLTKTGAYIKGLAPISSVDFNKNDWKFLDWKITPKTIALGAKHGFILSDTQALYFFGNNEYGCSADASIKQDIIVNLEKIKPLEFKIVQITCGHAFSAFLSDKNQIHVFGAFIDSLDVPHYLDNAVFLKDQVKFITSTQNVLYYITLQGEFWSVGFGPKELLGYDTLDFKTRSQKTVLKPHRIYSSKSKKQPRFNKIFAGGDYTFLLDEVDQVWYFGKEYAQLTKYKPLDTIRVKDIAIHKSEFLFLTLNGDELYYSDNVLDKELNLIPNIPKLKSIYYSQSGVSQSGASEAVAYGIDIQNNLLTIEKKIIKIGNFLSNNHTVLNFQATTHYSLLWTQEKDDL